MNRKKDDMNNILEIRSQMLFELRSFFMKREYIEVETPLRLREMIPEDHIEPFSSEDYFLQSSPEISMKRLLARGYEKIFQICKSFRKGERGDLHISEMTMLEWYQAGKTYIDLMDETESLILHLCEKFGIEDITRKGKNISFISNFDKLSVEDAISKYTDYSYEESLDNFDEIFGIEICPKLGFGKPVFLYNFPASEASLAKLDEKNPKFAQRFELFIGGVEICNCFSELINPEEQRKRFEETILFRKNSGKSSLGLPEQFLSELVSMPESSGNALGLDRLIMVLNNKERIDNVLAFIPEDI